MTDPVDNPVDKPYVPLVVPPDPARDARVAARRAADSRRAGIALDNLLRAEAPRVAVGLAYHAGWRDGYAASQAAHNGHYGVAPGPDCPRDYGCRPEAPCPAVVHWWES